MSQKFAYLTIDDAPSTHMRQKVDFLLQKNIPAIFFCEGKKIEMRPEPVIYAIQHGFVIGNHSYTHPAFSTLSLAESLAEIEQTDAIIEAIYQEAGRVRPANYFRFPYGDKGGQVGNYPITDYHPTGAQRKAAIQQQLRDLGYRQPVFDNITYAYYQNAGLLTDADWYWTFDTFDWSVYSETPMYGITSLEAVYARIDEDKPEEARGLHYPHSEEIILIHDHDNSHDLFGLIVARLLEIGLRFKLPDELEC